jgi:hypothetical protein
VFGGVWPVPGSTRLGGRACFVDSALHRERLTQERLTRTYPYFAGAVEPDRVRRCNADMALACYQVVVGHPRRERQLQALDLPAWRPAVRFNIGPGYRVRPDDTEECMGEILHSWVPRR